MHAAHIIDQYIHFQQRGQNDVFDLIKSLAHKTKAETINDSLDFVGLGVVGIQDNNWFPSKTVGPPVKQGMYMNQTMPVLYLLRPPTHGGVKSKALRY